MTSSSEEIYDIAIIGGGIAGAGVLRDASLRGAKAILFEKNQFGSGTSSKSSKLIHGGIRYLEIAWEHLLKGRFKECFKNFNFVFSALKECRTLQKIAPDLVTPLPILIPIYKNEKRHPFMIYMGALFYSFLALFSGEAKWPKIYWSKKKIQEIIPEIRSEDLLGGIQIWDRLTNDQKLTQKTILSATNQGAESFENHKVVKTEYLLDKKYHLIHVQDRLGQNKIYKSRSLVHAIGPWMNSNIISHIAGSHIHLKNFLPVSTLLQAKDSRVFFCVVIGDEIRVGTTEWRYQDPDTISPTQKDIKYLLDSLNYYFPNKAFKASDILHSDAGIRPLYKSTKTKDASAISREHALVKGNEGELFLAGVKLTDHRRAAEDVMDELCPYLKQFNSNLKNTSSTDKIIL